MNGTEVTDRLQTQINKLNEIKSLLLVGIGDLTNPNGSVNEDHQVNFYNILIQLLDMRSYDLEKIIDTLKTVQE